VKRNNKNKSEKDVKRKDANKSNKDEKRNDANKNDETETSVCAREHNSGAMLKCVKELDKLRGRDRSGQSPGGNISPAGKTSEVRLSFLFSMSLLPPSLPISPTNTSRTDSPPPVLTRDNIPWPVKSGRFADLSALAVREFFNNACPDTTNATLMFRVMRGESLKWHSDRWPLALPGFVIGDQERGVLHTIWHVVFELREQAQARRTSMASLS